MPAPTDPLTHLMGRYSTNPPTIPSGPPAPAVRPIEIVLRHRSRRMRWRRGALTTRATVADASVDCAEDAAGFNETIAISANPSRRHMQRPGARPDPHSTHVPTWQRAPWFRQVRGFAS